ncbi:hypothetical protein [Lactococcus lactis]|uniref:hypothetical protein n=1 Tax=Lactococcus lactis TaxID=1358 RepID=UPI0022DF6649|nr:hypothetical protein [Lactococcus lactis]
MKNEVQGIFQGAIDTFHQKMFWKIQGLNLFMIVKRIVYYVLIALSLIYVVSVTSQGIHLSSFQKVNIFNGISIFVLIFLFFKVVKNSFRGSNVSFEVSKFIVSGFLWNLMFYLAFSTNLTSYEKISNLVWSGFVVAFLFRLIEIIVFRKLSKQIENDKKPDWVDLVEQQVTKKFEDERLSYADVSETYKLKYSRISFKVNRRTIIENSVINLEE